MLLSRVIKQVYDDSRAQTFLPVLDLERIHSSLNDTPNITRHKLLHRDQGSTAQYHMPPLVTKTTLSHGLFGVDNAPTHRPTNYPLKVIPHALQHSFPKTSTLAHSSFPCIPINHISAATFNAFCPATHRPFTDCIVIFPPFTLAFHSSLFHAPRTLATSKMPINSVLPPL